VNYECFSTVTVWATCNSIGGLACCGVVLTEFDILISMCSDCFIPRNGRVEGLVFHLETSIFTFLFFIFSALINCTVRSIRLRFTAA